MVKSKTRPSFFGSGWVSPERRRQALSVTRCIRENSGCTGKMLAARLGWNCARTVRQAVEAAREIGEPITIGLDGRGYYHMDDISDPVKRAELLGHHRNRSRDFMVGYAKLMKQIGKFTVAEIAQQTLFDLLMKPCENGDIPQVNSVADLAEIPGPQRAEITNLLFSLLEGIQRDPLNFAVEKAELSKRFGKVFISETDARRIARAKEIMSEISVN